MASFLLILLLGGWAAWYNRSEFHPRRGFVLQYHSVVEELAAVVAKRSYERLFSVSAAAFAAQMRGLAAAGYRFLSNAELLDALTGKGALPPRWVAVTFDDGWQSIYDHAWPVLRELKIPATIFLTTDSRAEVFTEKAAVDAPLTEAMVREMAAGGIDFQGHGVTHADLSRMAEERVRWELTESRAAIAALTGRPVDSFSLPGTTRHTRELVQISRELGYRGIHTPFIGAVAPGAEPMMVRRIMVEGSFDLDTFWANLRPLPILQRKLISYLKKLPPRLLGPRLWMPVRAYLFESRLAFLLTLRGLKIVLGVAVVVVALLAWWIAS